MPRHRGPSALFVLVVFVVVIASCAGVNTYYDASRPHHTPEGFRNTYAHPEKGGFWRWKWEQWKHGTDADRLAPPGGWQFPILERARELLSGASGAPQATWIGHATVLVRINGVHIITDPQFSERASPIAFAGPKRVTPPGIALADLPHIDAVVISHDHYDHLDIESVKALAVQKGGSPRFFAGLGMKPWFAQFGIVDVVELDWWQSAEHKGVAFHFVPVQHWAKRSLWDENRRLWGGWVVKHPTFSFFFTGDAGYSRDFRDIGERFGPFDLAAIPIGAYAPRWFMYIMHVDPDEAVRVHQDVRARRSLGIHWGTFGGLTDEAMDEPPKRLAEARARTGLAESDFFVLRHGETRRFTSR